MFLRKGYKTARLREIAEACGMSECAIYEYVGSESDILHLICARRSGGAERLKKLLHDMGNISRTEALSRCIRQHIANADDGASANLLFNREIRSFSREDRRGLLASQADIHEFFKQLLVEGVKAGEFNVDSPALVAHIILMMGQDWALRRWFLRSMFSLEEYAEDGIKFVLDAIVVKSDDNVTLETAGAKAGEME